MDSHKDLIVKILRMWGGLRTSQVLQKLWDSNVSIGANSLTRRLREMQEQNEIESFYKNEDKEKTWKLKIFEKTGQGVMF